MRGKVAGSLLLFAAMVLAGKAFGEVKQGDYLKLTRENLPSAQVIIESSLKHLDFDQTTTRQHRRLARLSALLPKVQFRALKQENQINEWGYVDNWQVRNGDITDGFARTGYSDRIQYDAFVEWDFGNFIINDFDFLTATAKITQDDQQQFLLTEVSKRYAALWELLPETPDAAVSASQAVKIEEHAGVPAAVRGLRRRFRRLRQRSVSRLMRRALR